VVGKGRDFCKPSWESIVVGTEVQNFVGVMLVLKGNADKWFGSLV
jgi:hypothetical protein